MEPCRVEHLKAIYSPCSYVNDPEGGEVVKKERSVEVRRGQGREGEGGGEG